MFSSFQKTFNEAVKQASSAAKDLSSQVVGAKLLREYTLGPQAASGGLGNCWKIHSATRKEGGGLVSVWIADKHTLLQEGEAAVAHARRDAQTLARLRHPAIVTVVAGLEETRGQLLFATEPILGSLADVLGGFQALPPAIRLAQEGKLVLSELERKAGLLQVVNGLQFLHTDCQLIHRSLCPLSVFITSAACNWKLGGLGSTCPSFLTAETPLTPTRYSSPNANTFTQPELPYVAPELAFPSPSAPKPTTAADVFALGLVAYELLSGEQLLKHMGGSLEEYESRIASLPTMPLPGIPVELQTTFRALLAPSPSLRPPPLAISAQSYFQEDALLRSVLFLDTFLQRDNLQKAAFLKDFALIWVRFDERVLRYRVVPSLLGEARNESLQPLLLPLLCKIVERLSDEDLATVVLPALASTLQTVSGQSLLLLVRETPAWSARVPRLLVGSLLVPFLGRALDTGEPQLQQETLKAALAVAPNADVSSIEAALVPRIHSCCLATTSAGVRSGALATLTALTPALPRSYIAPTLQMIRQVTAVDKTASTAEGALQLGGALARFWGAEATAEGVLPVLTPLLTCPSLTPQQFGLAMRMVRDLLELIESSRGVVQPSPSQQSLGSYSAATGAPRPSSQSSLGSPAHSLGAPSQQRPTQTASPAQHRLSSASEPSPTWQHLPPAAGKPPAATEPQDNWGGFEGGGGGDFADFQGLSLQQAAAPQSTSKDPFFLQGSSQASGPLPAAGMRINLAAAKKGPGVGGPSMKLGKSSPPAVRQEPASLI